MTILDHIRSGKRGVLVMGSHTAIVQSMLDFDFLSSKTPSVIALVGGNRKAQKYFWGTGEILIPCYKSINAIPVSLKKEIFWMLNLQSGRRAFESSIAFFESFPDALGGSIFAENVPERHAIELIQRFGSRKFIAGPASVGLLVPGSLKLGAIGGVDLFQVKAASLATPGSVAVGSTSGGMTNELIRAVVAAGKRVSFAAAVGGDRFPIASLTELFTLAEADAATKAFVYFGELGGADEYEIIELIKAEKFTKPLVAYIGGVIDEAFDEHVQFGHAKALVRQEDESARAKRVALRAAGVAAPETFPEFLEALKKLSHEAINDTVMDIKPLMNRQKSILSTREITNVEDMPGKKGSADSFVTVALGALLGRKIQSPVTKELAEEIFTLLIDHGGHVSGAVNTMITARAGKDLVSSLASGLLTIGPRFGGAVNAAALAWLSGVTDKKDASAFVAEWNKAGEPIPGIGHKKYRVGLPDPRVASLAKFAKRMKKHPHYDFARAVEAVTTGKNGSLILNIDGVLAALLLDTLAECEGLKEAELKELADAEFFNAFFVIPRTVGFIAHFIEQKKNDEGLFRLPDELLFVRGKPSSKKGA